MHFNRYSIDIFMLSIPAQKNFLLLFGHFGTVKNKFYILFFFFCFFNLFLLILLNIIKKAKTKK